MSEFRDELIQLSRRAVERQRFCLNEEQTKLSLILPFLRFLGHDPANPAEIAPEHVASFDTRHSYRVDFAVMFDGVPTIAIECKAVGGLSQSTAGQLRGYFNAIESVKLGIATDGLVYELYADSDSPNMMDAKPFFQFDLNDFAKGLIDDEIAAAIEGLMRRNFDPSKIGAEARRRLVGRAIYEQIAQMWDDPPDELVRFLLKRADVGRVGVNARRQYADLIPEAFRRFVQDRLVQVLNLGDDDDTPEVEGEDESATEDDAEARDREIVTTQREIDFFQECKNRLYFLCRDDELFSRVSDVEFRDFKGKFIVYYKKPRTGRLLEAIDDESAYRVRLPGQDAFFTAQNPAEFGDQLIDSFRRRVAELG